MCVFMFPCIGICTQHDQLWPDLTTREHLHIYAALRMTHFDKGKFAEYIERAIKGFSLQEYLHKKVAQLSGGMKR